MTERLGDYGRFYFFIQALLQKMKNCAFASLKL